jgi:hypothetical protein
VTTPKDGKNHQSDNFEAALVAMQRAAEVARQRARRGSGTLVVWRDGRIVKERVEPVAENENPS